MTPPDVGALALAGVFGLGALPKLAGVAESRAFAARLGVRYRVFRLVGACELTGAIGLLAGVLVDPAFGIAAAVGLTLLALSGCVAHLRAREPWTAYLPALALGTCTALVAVTLG